MRPSIPLFRPSIGAAEVAAATRALLSGILSNGPEVKGFEAALKAMHGVKHAVSVNSCTSALHLTLEALGIGAGHEVVTTPISWPATTLAIAATGATPIFADVDPRTGLLDPSAVRRAVTANTRALVPVHLHGQPCDAMGLLSMSLPVVWDCAHAIETRVEGRPVGSFPVAACFSFYGSKNATTGEGGAMLTDDDDIAAYVRRARLFGMGPDKLCIQPGLKCNLPEVSAAIGRVQLAGIEGRWAERELAWAQYLVALTDVPAAVPPTAALRGPAGEWRHGLHLFAVQVANAAMAQAELREQGVEAGRHYRLMTEHPWIRSVVPNRHHTPGAREFGQRTLSLPFWPGMAPAVIREVVQALGRVLA